MTEKLNIKKALKLLDDYYVPENIKKHSLNVSKVATFVSQKYLEKKLINRKTQIKIIIAAILHDITKITEIQDFEELFDKNSKDYESAILFWKEMNKKYADIDHEDSAQNELRKYSEDLAEMIKKTKYIHKLNNHDLRMNILIYADLRDEMGEIVHLAHRLILSNKRYAHKNTTVEHWNKVIEFNIVELEREKKLFENIDAEPEECNKLNKINILELLTKFSIDINEGL